MELEKINNEYVKLKNELKKVEQEIKNLEDSSNYLASDKIIWSGKLEEAKRNKDDVAKNTAETEVKRIDQDLKKVKEDVVKRQEELTPLKEKFDDIIKKIKEDPEMAKHLNEVMSKKYNRKIANLEKENHELIKRENRIINLQRLVTDHPALANNLKGIFVAQKEIQDLSVELKTTTDIARADEIKNKLLPQAEHKLETNKAPLMAYIAKKSLMITEQDIDGLTSKGYKKDAKGNIDLNATMNSNIASIKRQIKGNEKSIKDHQTALNNLGNGSRTKGMPLGTSTPPVPISEPKWYQFGTRLKNWYERSSNPLVERFRNWRESRIESEPTPVSKKENAFRNSMKYEVVHDIVNQVEKDDLKQAKKERKEEISR